MNHTIYTFAWGNNPRRAALKGRCCKLLAAGALNSCEVVFVDTGQREVVSRRALKSTRCQGCGQPVIEIDFSRQYCVRLCDNVQCRLYAERQGVRERGDNEGELYMERRRAVLGLVIKSKARKTKEVDPETYARNERRRNRPGYQRFLSGKKEHYRILRDLGYSCKDAQANCSNKRMEELGVFDAV